MKNFREVTSTISDFTESKKSPPSERMPTEHSNRLSGGTTMWQARLVLSTLDQRGQWATRLRNAIRRGDEELADNLLDAIYARNSTPPRSHAESSPPTPSSRTNTTVLPPSPLTEDQVAS